MNQENNEVESYKLVAYSVASGFDFKALPSQLEQRDTRIHRPEGCEIYELGFTKKVFVFPYATVVFFNVPESEHAEYMRRLGAPITDTTQARSYSKDDYTIRVEHNTLDVEIDFAILPDIELRKILLVAQLVAQSTALQLIEWQVEKFLSESEDMTRFLRRFGAVRKGRRDILQFIGNSLVTRHKIVRQLSLFNRPDVTWESDELYELYDQMIKIDIFDVEQRVDNVEKMLELCGDVTDLLLEISHTKRAEMLELIIIFLILIEVVRAFFH